MCDNIEGITRIQPYIFMRRKNFQKAAGAGKRWEILKFYFTIASVSVRQQRRRRRRRRRRQRHFLQKLHYNFELGVELLLSFGVGFLSPADFWDVGGQDWL